MKKAFPRDRALHALHSQGYPLVSSELLGDAFKTQTAARAFVKERYRAEASDIAIK